MLSSAPLPCWYQSGLLDLPISQEFPQARLCMFRMLGGCRMRMGSCQLSFPVWRKLVKYGGSYGDPIAELEVRVVTRLDKVVRIGKRSNHGGVSFQNQFHLLFLKPSWLSFPIITSPLCISQVFGLHHPYFADGKTEAKKSFL